MSKRTYVEIKDVLHIVDIVAADEKIRKKCKAIRKRLKELPVVEVKHNATDTNVGSKKEEGADNDL